MTRHRLAALLLVACLGALALASHAQAATASKLLTKFQPVTYFEGDELFRPTSVDGFIADSILERFNPATGTFDLVDPNPAPGTLPSSGAGWRLNQQPCSAALGLAGEACYATSWSAHGAPVTAYGNVVRTDNRVVVQYWFFYYHNLYTYTPVPSDFISQSHEGDWEVVNVVLDADEDPLAVAKRVAKEVRERDGGLPGVKALGFDLPAKGLVQVSMNLVDHRKTSPVQAFEEVQRRARAAGVEVAESELVGLVPRAACPPGFASRVRLASFDPSQVIETRLAERRR